MINCIWNVIITISSVGYGELYPKTFFGRVIGIVICFWGLFIVSILVVVVTDQLELSKLEDITFNHLRILTLKQELKKKAIDVV